MSGKKRNKNERPKFDERNAALREIAATVPGPLGAAVDAAIYRAGCLIENATLRDALVLLGRMRTLQGTAIDQCDAKIRAMMKATAAVETPLVDLLRLAIIFENAVTAEGDGLDVQARVHLAQFRDEAKLYRPMLRTVPR